MPDVEDLVEWLRQQLDEDERVAREAVRVNPLALTLCIHLPPEVIHHNDRHDPGRVLRDVEAKRRIIDAYEWATSHPSRDQETGFWHRKGAVSSLADTLLLLALPYADRPGYRQEWAP